MATKGYVVSEGSFSYDDNYYSSEDGGHPNKIFLNEDEAKEYAYDLGLEMFQKLIQGDEIFEYGYGDIDGVFNVDEEFESFIKEKIGVSAEEWWERRYSGKKKELKYSGKKVLKLSDDDWKNFYDFCNLTLTSVSEVGFGDVFS